MPPRPPLPATAEADLRKLVEPLAGYIAAVNRPKAALILTMLLLTSSLQEINEAANACIADFGKPFGG